MLAVSVVICTIEHSGRELRLQEVVRQLRLQEDVMLQIILVF